MDGFSTGVVDPYLESLCDRIHKERMRLVAQWEAEEDPWCDLVYYLGHSSMYGNYKDLLEEADRYIKELSTGL